MTNGRGFTSICEGLDDKSHDNGHLLILRYILSLFENASDPVTLDSEEAAERFPNHARIVERVQGIEVHGLIEKTILRLPYSQQLAFTVYMLKTEEANWQRGCLKLQLLILYMKYNLYTSGTHYLKENKADIAEDICSLLLGCNFSKKATVRMLAITCYGEDFIELLDELVRGAISRREIELSHRLRASRLWDLVRDDPAARRFSRYWNSRI